MTPLSRMEPSDRRLVRGYGPALLIGAGFLAMALLVPTVSPEQNVVTTSPGAQAGATGLQAGGGPATAGGAPNAAGVASGSTSSGSRAASGGNTPASAPGVVSTCSGAQVPGDPYSPPCVSFTGDNGGATSHGVTANSIIVSYRNTADNVSSVTGAIQQIAGKYNSAAFNVSAADVQRTLNDLVTYFNEKFQFYGRKLVLKQFNGVGQLTQEITDAGQANAGADAITAAQTVGAFADISGSSQPYDEALTTQKVVNIGSPYMSQQWYQAHAPYAWSYFPNCTDLGDEGAAISVKELLPGKVSYAGEGITNGSPRRFAVLAPDNPVYQQCAAQVTGAMAKAGHPVVANLSYTLDLSQLSQEAGSLEQQIVNDNITTVLCGCDPITLIYLTGDLDNAHYQPEWFNIGAAFTDVDLVAQLLDSGAWAHAAGVTNNGVVPPFGSSLAYFAAKSVDPGNPPASGIVDILYENLYILALGIELAGPDLTPQNFERGLFSYGGGTGEYGTWSFNNLGSPEWTTQHDFRFEWWDPKAVSSSDGQQGAWQIGPTQYGLNDIPAGPPPVFPNGPQ